MLIKHQGQGNLASGRDADKRFFKGREILLQEEMLINDFFQGQGNLASGRDADKRFFSRTGKPCFRRRC